MKWLQCGVICYPQHILRFCIRFLKSITMIKHFTLPNMLPIVEMPLLNLCLEHYIYLAEAVNRMRIKLTCVLNMPLKTVHRKQNFY